MAKLGLEARLDRLETDIRQMLRDYSDLILLTVELLSREGKSPDQQAQDFALLRQVGRLLHDELAALHGCLEGCLEDLRERYG